MTVHELLRAAAEAGRQSPPPADDLARYGHHPAPPTLRCQTCGRLLWFSTAEWRWFHAESADDPIDPAFDAAFDEVYRR